MKLPDTARDRAETSALRFAASLLQLVRHHQTLFFALATRGTALLVSFVVTYLVGRNFGAAATGEYALVTQTTMFLAVAGLLGLDVSVVRHLAKAVAERRPLSPVLLAKVLGTGLAMLGVVVAVLIAGGQPVWNLLFGHVVGREALLVMCVLIFGRGGALLLGGLLRSQHRFNLGLAVTNLVIPAVCACALLSGLAYDVNSALWATGVGGAIALVIGLAAMLPRPGSGEVAVTIPMRAIMASSLPLWGAGVALAIGEWYGLAVAAQMLGATDAGLYRVSFQLSSVLTIVSFTLFSVYSAQMSTAFHADDLPTVARLARAATVSGTLLTAPVAVAMLVGGKLLLQQFGEEFVPAYPVLVAMVIAQLLIAMTGPCGLVLAMSGNERANLAISLGGTVALLVSGPLAALAFGLFGLSLCVSVVLVGRNIAAYFIVRHRLDIRVWKGTVGHQDAIQAPVAP